MSLPCCIKELSENHKAFQKLKSFTTTVCNTKDVLNKISSKDLRMKHVTFYILCLGIVCIERVYKKVKCSVPKTFRCARDDI